jgi:hypothetical protein
MGYFLDHGGFGHRGGEQTHTTTVNDVVNHPPSTNLYPVSMKMPVTAHATSALPPGDHRGQFINPTWNGGGTNRTTTATTTHHQQDRRSNATRKEAG